MPRWTSQVKKEPRELDWTKMLANAYMLSQLAGAGINIATAFGKTPLGKTQLAKEQALATTAQQRAGMETGLIQALGRVPPKREPAEFLTQAGPTKEALGRFGQYQTGREGALADVRKARGGLLQLNPEQIPAYVSQQLANAQVLTQQGMTKQASAIINDTMRNVLKTDESVRPVDVGAWKPEAFKKLAEISQDASKYINQTIPPEEIERYATELEPLVGRAFTNKFIGELTGFAYTADMVTQMGQINAIEKALSDATNKDISSSFKGQLRDLLTQKMIGIKPSDMEVWVNPETKERKSVMKGTAMPAPWKPLPKEIVATKTLPSGEVGGLAELDIYRGTMVDIEQYLKKGLTGPGEMVRRRLSEWGVWSDEDTSDLRALVARLPGLMYAMRGKQLSDKELEVALQMMPQMQLAPREFNARFKRFKQYMETAIKKKRKTFREFGYAVPKNEKSIDQMTDEEIETAIIQAEGGMTY